MLLIAHNMAVVRHVCDRVAVMYLGRIVEEAPTDELFTNARHPYTQGSAARRAAARSRPRVGGRGRRRRSAEPDRPADRLPVPSALPDRTGAALLDGGPGARRCVRRRSRRRLPLRVDGATAGACSRGDRGGELVRRSLFRGSLGSNGAGTVDHGSEPASHRLPVVVGVLDWRMSRGDGKRPDRRATPVRVTRCRPNLATMSA